MRSPATSPDTRAAETGTRERLLGSALLLFRRHGYHGVGLNEILARAGAPKGSLYHHFPGGQEQIAVAVIDSVAHGVAGLIEQSAGRSAAALMRGVGRQIAAWMAHTGDGTCAVLASFAADGDTAPAVREAVAAAYTRIADVLAARMQPFGWPNATARESAYLAIAVLEGAGLVAQARQRPDFFDRAVEHAASLFGIIPTARLKPARSRMR